LQEIQIAGCQGRIIVALHLSFSIQVYVEQWSSVARCGRPRQAVASSAVLCSYVISNDRLLWSIHSRSLEIAYYAAQYKVYRQSGAVMSIALHANCCSNNCTM